MARIVGILVYTYIYTCGGSCGGNALHLSSSAETFYDGICARCTIQSCRLGFGISGMATTIVEVYGNTRR